MAVESSARLPVAKASRKQRSYAAAQQRHEQRRRQTLARHVGDDECQPAVAEIDHVVVVAADLGGRLHPRVNRHESMV